MIGYWVADSVLALDIYIWSYKDEHMPVRFSSYMLLSIG